MASIPLPALHVASQPDPTENLGRMLALRSQLQNAPIQRQILEQQAQQGALQNQETQYQMGARKAVNEAYQGAVKIDENGHPNFDQDALTKHLSDAGYGSEAPTILKHLTDYQKSRTDLMEAQNKIEATSKDAMGSVGRAIQESKYDPNLAQTILEHGLADPTLSPQGKQQLLQMRQAVAQNPDMVKHWADNAVAQSPAQQKFANERDVATIRASKPPEGELPLGADRVGQLNQGLAARFQVLNPGKQLPAFLALPATGTQKDFDRADKLLESQERATGTKAQQETANAMRAETQRMAKQSQQDREDQQGLTPVVGTDPKTGKDVLVSASEAKSLGLTAPMKADADLVNKSHAARTWLKLATTEAPEGSPAEKMGILQLVDKLDKAGKLGVVASRWNEFLAGKVGAGDPDVAALRAKMGLSATKLMQAHVGSRGGAFMLEHFEDLANAKKMDASTLRAGIKSEAEYMDDVAMMPGGKKAPSAGPQAAAANTAAPAGATHTAMGSDKKLHYTNDKGQDLGVAE